MSILATMSIILLLLGGHLNANILDDDDGKLPFRILIKSNCFVDN